MLVFTPEWTQSIKNRYRNHANYERPFTYFLTISNEYAFLREEIETFVQFLTDQQKPVVISRLREDKHFHHTYNELVTGHFLRQLGHDVEYEKITSIDGKVYTPDWYVDCGKTKFAVEVFTIEGAESRQEDERKLGYFWGRLREIEINAIITIELNWGQIPDQKESKQIILRLENWLRSEPPKNEILTLGVLTFEFLGKHPGNKVDFMGPTVVSRLDKDRLRNKIQEKVKKYKNLDIPLAVCVVPNLLSGIDLDDALEVLHGQESTVIDSEQISNTRLKDGLYTGKQPISSSLSVVIWLPKKPERPLFLNEVAIFPNPSAAYPIPLNYFKTKRD